MCLDTSLCLKYRRRVGRDNTVKYRWRTLQLLPGTDRPSYAGAVVDVLEGLDGQLAVQHEGQIIPTQEAPQRPNILRNFTERTVHTPSPHIDSNGPGRRWADKLAQLDVEVSQDTADSNGAGRVRKAVSPRQIIPTQEAPQRPNILRNFTERTVHTPSPHLDSNGPGRRWADKLAQLDVEVSQDTADSNGRKGSQGR